MTKLSVNINKVALIRNSRGKNRPDLAEFSNYLIDLGAQGITVHPRPDERHIKFSDLVPLKTVCKARGVEFNIEGYPSDDFIDSVLEAAPDQVTLVPDPPEALTSSAGFNVSQQKELLSHAFKRLKTTRISVFVEPGHITEPELQWLKENGASRVELYTEAYAENFHRHPVDILETYRKLALQSQKVGLGVNAGHDLTSENLPLFLKSVPGIQEVSIGHQLVIDCLYFGAETTMRRYLHACRT